MEGLCDETGCNCLCPNAWLNESRSLVTAKPTVAYGSGMCEPTT